MSRLEGSLHGLKADPSACADDQDCRHGVTLAESSRAESLSVAASGILVATRLPAHILQEPAHCIELRAEAGPVSGFQALDRLIVALERLARAICRKGW